MKQETLTKEPPQENELVLEKLNNSVISVLSSTATTGFKKAYVIANAAQELKTLLTSEYMKPIMALQGNKLGFRTDKDLNRDGSKGLGYPEAVVKDCLIEAVLTGVQPFGNQFNIIAGNCYITKEGFGYLLKNIEGLSYEIVPQLPRINGDRTSAAITMHIEWTIAGFLKKSRDLDVPVKLNAYMGTDAVIGKATRKARAWLFNTINDCEISDGDINDTVDADAKVVSSKVNEEIEIEDLKLLYENKKGLLSAEDQLNADRIISTQETNSYSKLFKHLQSL